jgi:MFS family permease
MTTRTVPKIFTHDFVLSFLAQFTFSSVSYLLIPTIPIYLSRFQAKGGEIGFLVGILSVCSLIPRPFVGRALQRIPERTFMMSGAVLYILSSIAYLLAPPFLPFFIVRVLQGVGLAFFSTASYTLIANITSENHRGQIISYYSLSANFAFAVAPYCGMLLINQFNFTFLFWACAGLSLCTSLIVTRLKKTEGIPIENQSRKKEPLFSREALPAALMVFLLNLIWGGLSAFFPLYALRQGISNPGFFFAILAVTLNFGRVLGGKLLDLYDRKKLILFCHLTTIVSLIILTFSHTYTMFILVAIILGLGLAFLFPSFIIYAIENSGSVRGPAMGTFMAFSDLGIGIGPMIMGIILQWTSYPVMFICLALTEVLNLGYFYYAIGIKGRDENHMMEERIV